MEHARECPEYTLSDGIRMGCHFTLEFLAEFTDFNICVNSSSPAGPMRPAFFSLQVQNHGTLQFVYNMPRIFLMTICLMDDVLQLYIKTDCSCTHIE